MIISRKAQGMSVETLLAIIVVSVVLIITIFFLAYQFFGARAIPFAEYLPSFGKEKYVTEGQEIIRYSIPRDSIEYYDGTKWIGFRGKEVQMNDKIISYAEVYDKIKNRYYGGREGKIVALNDKISITISKDIPYSPITVERSAQKKNIFVRGWNFVFGGAGESLNKPITVPQGAVQAYLLVDKKVSGLYILNSKDELEFYQLDEYVRDQSVIDQDSAIKSALIEWRDAPLKNPVTFTYGILTESKAKETKQISVCVQKRGDDLVADFGFPRESCG